MTRSQKIFLGLFLGIVAGILINKFDPAIAPGIKVFSQIFLRLIKMIIAPLVFSTLVVGMAKMGDGNSLGRIAGKAILWFFSASVLSLLMGMALVNGLEPGGNLHLPLPEVSAQTGLEQEPPTLQAFISHIVPKSVVEAMAQTAAVIVVAFLGKEAEGKLVYFMSVDDARFRKPVVPGDSVRIHVTKTHRRGNVWKFEGICKVDDKVVAEANFSAMVVDG